MSETQTKSEPNVSPSLPSFLAEPHPGVENKAVAIHMIDQVDMDSCNFWLGLFQHGKSTPSQLLDLKKVNDIFNQAATDGLAEGSPVMLSDSSVVPAKFVYLLPEPSQDLAAKSEWIGNLVTTVKSWSPEKAGIYLAPELLDQSSSHELLVTIMRELIKESNTTDYYFIPGNRGLNSLLNTSLKIKQYMEEQSITVYVFH